MLNQIALKPFISSLAAREGQSYQSIIQSAASDMAGLNADEFLSSPQTQASDNLGKVLRVKASDAEEIRGDLKGVDVRVAGSFLNSMAVMAMALDPATGLALDGAMRLLMMGEAPLPQSSVKGDQLTLQPSLAHTASQLDTDVPGLLKQAAAEYLAHPEFDDQSKARADASIAAASVFKLDAGEVGALKSDLGQLGLNDYQQEALLSGLAMNAVAYEPTFRSGLDGIFGLYMRGEKPLEQSSYQSI